MAEEVNQGSPPQDPAAGQQTANTPTDETDLSPTAFKEGTTVEYVLKSPELFNEKTGPKQAGSVIGKIVCDEEVSPIYVCDAVRLGRAIPKEAWDLQNPK